MCDWGNWRLACTNTRVTDRNVGLRQDHCNHWMETVRLTYQNHIMDGLEHWTKDRQDRQERHGFHRH